MIDFSAVYNNVDEFLQTREGLSTPKNAQDYPIFVRELTGIFCGAAHENGFTTQDISMFLTEVQRHEIIGVNDNGRLNDVSDLISPRITSHPLYDITEYALMNYKPGNVQVGPGEFFFCFYDRGSVFGIDNMAGFDIVLDQHPTELKKLGSNFTDPELFDKYAESPKVSRLLVVKPVSNAKKPLFRSQYACVTFSKNNWREAFTHIGKAGTLALVA